MSAKMDGISFKLLSSYLIIILVPAIAIFIIYNTMRVTMFNIQIERAQTALGEAALTFDKEIEQMVNIGKYISSDIGLKNYAREAGGVESEGNYYEAYKLAVSYPDYTVLNRFVSNIYIYMPEDSYVLEIPRVIPNNARGLATLGIDGLDGILELDQDGLIDYGVDDTNILVLQRFECAKARDGKGIVAIEIEQNQLRKLLRGTLGNDRGAAFLVDKNGEILCAYDQLTGSGKTVQVSMSWEQYMEEAGWKESAMAVQHTAVGYNQWSIVSVLYRSDLFSKMSGIRYAILLLCIVSILIGVSICLWYWSVGWSVMKRYDLFFDKYPERRLSWKTSAGMWKAVGRVLDCAETLWEQVGQHEQWATDEILRKILYGSYDSMEELENEIMKVKIALPLKLPCRIVGVDIEDSMKQEPAVARGKIEERLKSELDREFPDSCQLVDIGYLKYALIVCGGREMDDMQWKGVLEEISHNLCRDNPLNIYMGIGGWTESIQDMAEEYEQVSRICEYARYNKIRVPLTIGEIPDYHQAVFTIDLEMQLEEIIRNGTREQLSMTMSQISETYLRTSGGICAGIGHNMELLRYIMLRCLDKEDSRLLYQTRHAKTPEELEEVVFEVWGALADRREREEDLNEEFLKKELEEKLEMNYAKPDFTMAELAHLMDTSEKKIYRDFKERFGISFSSYLEMIRIRHAQEYLKEGMSVQDVAAACGYGSDYTFRRAFKRVVGATPSSYQKMFTGR